MPPASKPAGGTLPVPSHPADAPRVQRAGARNRTDEGWTVAPMGTWAPGRLLHARLLVLLAEGHSYAEIGRRLGYRKNAISGVVHRYHLSQRGSPIRPTDTPSRETLWLRKWRAAQRAGLPLAKSVGASATLAPLASLGEPRVARRAVQAPPAVVPAPAPRRVTGTCVFPLGTPGQPNFRWCDASVLRPNSPYCEECRSICYVRRKDVA